MHNDKSNHGRGPYRDWSDFDKREHRRRANELRARCRVAALKLYGDGCECCGTMEPIFLAFDHVLGGGNRWRKSAEYKGHTKFYQWLVETGERRPEFRLLCHNCNWAEAHGGCPHQATEAGAVA